MDTVLLILIITGAVGQCSREPVSFHEGSGEDGGAGGSTETTTAPEGGDGGAGGATTTASTTTSSSEGGDGGAGGSGGSGGAGGYVGPGPLPGSIGSVCDTVADCDDGLVCVAVETEAMGGLRICTVYCKFENGSPVLDSCGDGLVCLGVPGAPACLLACTDASECPDGFFCNAAFGGFCSP